MDFNAIVNKLREIEPTDISNPNAEAPKADTKAPVVLSEAAQLRIKAGISTVLAESKKVEEAVEMCPEACCGKPVTECKCGPDCEHCDCHSKNAAMKESKVKEIEGKFVNKGAKLEKVKVKNESEEKSKTFDEEIEAILESVKSKLVKEGGVGNMKLEMEEDAEHMSKEEFIKTHGQRYAHIWDRVRKDMKGDPRTNESKTVKEAKKKMVKVDGKMVPDYAADGKGKDDLTKKGGAKKADAKKDDAPASKGLSAKQKKLPAGLQKAIAKKKGKTESVVTTKKKAVAESMKFLDAIKIVKESNGEMKIDAVDTAIWNWAKRVASSKVTEGGLKAEAYAAKVYESVGGTWDVSRKIISE